MQDCHHYIAHLNILSFAHFPQVNFVKKIVSLTPTHTHTVCNHEHLQGISHKTYQEEQMSLSADIKNHHFDSFTNSHVTPPAEDK